MRQLTTQAGGAVALAVIAALVFFVRRKWK